MHRSIGSGRTRRFASVAAEVSAVVLMIGTPAAVSAAAVSGPCDVPAEHVATDQALVGADQARVTADEGAVTNDMTVVASDRAQLEADVAAKNTAAVAADKAKLVTDIAQLKADKVTRRADKQQMRIDTRSLRADQAILARCLLRPPLWATVVATPANPLLGSAVSLAGTATNGKSPYAYAWTQVAAPAGSTAALTGANSSMASVTPDVPGDYEYQLTVTDAAGKTASDVASFTTGGPPVILSATASNAAPPVGSLVALVGVGEDGDGDALSWHWSIDSAPSGSTATLEHPDAAGAAFTPDVTGAYRLRVTLTDTTGQSTNATVRVDAALALMTDVTPPGSNPTVGQPVPLEARTTGGTAPYTYIWTITGAPAGSAAVINPPDAATAEFTPDLPGAYQVSLAVTDSAGATMTTEPLLVVVTPVLPPPTGPTFDVACGDTAGLIQALTDVGAAGLPSDAAAVINLNPEGTADCTYPLVSPLPGSGSSVPAALPPIDTAVYIHGHGSKWDGPGADPNSDPDPASSFSAVVVDSNGMLSADNLSMPTFHPDKGGAIYNQGFVSMTNCNISNNVAITAGGGIYNDQGFLSLNNCAINHNWVTSNLARGGGGIFNDHGWVTLTNCTVNNNTVKHSGNGGGIVNVAGFVGLTGSVVQANTTPGVGGGIAGEKNGPNSVLGVYGTSTISSNSARDGGGVWNEGSAFVTDSQVNSNTATGSNGGGGIDASGLLFLTRSSVSFNQATGTDAAGGGVFVHGFGGDALTANDSLINYNSASYGGGLAAIGPTAHATLTNSTQLRGNSASKAGAGAYAQGPNIPNQASLSVESGSSIVANQGLGVRADFATFALDAATVDSNDGPGISAGGDISITNNSSVTSNQGAGVFTDQTLVVSNSSISGNSNSSYPEDGGGINASGSVTLTNATIAGNSAGSQGGGLYLAGGSVSIQNSNIVGNSAQSGGGMYATFDLAPFGGCVCLNTWTSIAWTGGSLANNTSVTKGGGILNEWAQITLTNVSRVNNKPDNCETYYYGRGSLNYTNGC